MSLDLDAIDANWRGSDLPGADVILVLVAEVRRLRTIETRFADYEPRTCLDCQQQYAATRASTGCLCPGCLASL